jgi:hypothetical protein
MEDQITTVKNTNLLRTLGQGYSISLSSNMQISELFSLEGGVQVNYGEINTMSSFEFVGLYKTTSRYELKYYGLNILSGFLWKLSRTEYDFYTRLGILTGFVNRIDEKMVSRNNTSPNEYQKSILRYEGGISYGIYAACGLERRISQSLSLHVEFLASNATYRPRERTLILREISGTDVLPDLNYNSRHTVFQKKYNTTDMFNSQMPQKAYYVYFPFGAYSMSLGITIDLNK